MGTLIQNRITGQQPLTITQNIQSPRNAKEWMSVLKEAKPPSMPYSQGVSNQQQTVPS